MNRCATKTCSFIEWEHWVFGNYTLVHLLELTNLIVCLLFKLSVFKMPLCVRTWVLYGVRCAVSFDAVNYIPVSFSQAGDRALCISLAICDYRVWCHLSLLSVWFLFLTEHLIPVSFLFQYSFVRLSRFVWEIRLLSHFFRFILAGKIGTCSFSALQSLLPLLLGVHNALFWVQVLIDMILCSPVFLCDLKKSSSMPYVNFQNLGAQKVLKILNKCLFYH